MTRTHTQCIDFTPSNNNCESYVGQSKGYGFCYATSYRGTFEGGRQISLLCQHLEGVDRGQLGITDHHRLSDFLCRATCAGKEATSAFLPIRTTHSNAGGDLFSPGKRGSDGSRQSLASTSVLLSTVSGPQEEWRNEASNQPQSPQPVSRDPSLQNGGPAYLTGPAKARRLASKGRPERCLPYSTHPPRTPTLPPV